MGQADFLQRIEVALRKAGIPHMLTGSVASSAFGRPRSTDDVDILIQPEPAQIDALLKLLPESDYYVSREAAYEALRLRTMFNVIDFATGWKVDLILLRDRPFDQANFHRRTPRDILGVVIPTTTPEDSILSKLDWRKESQSERQYEDAVRVAVEQWAVLDQSYLRKWAIELGVSDDVERLLRDADELRAP